MGARALNAEFLMDIESRMQVIQERDFSRLLSNLWWPSFVKTRTSTGKKDYLTWLLSTAMIRSTGKGGNVRFDDMVSQLTEIVNEHAGTGLRLNVDQFTDSDGGGVNLASSWSADIGAYMAYWPQKQATQILKLGHLASSFQAYDGKAFFATDHPVNPYKPGAGTYSNLFTGANALPIDESVTSDVALANLGKVFGRIASIKMPNGEDPRFLRPKGILCSPTLFPRAVHLTGSEMIAQAAASGGGGADVRALKQALGYATPTMADELAGFEDDKTYFVFAEQITQSELGGIVYQERKPFRINWFGDMGATNLDAMLARAKELEWEVDGRNAIAPGHPYMVFKVKGE